MARRLPVFFLLDVSESMIGEPPYQMHQALDLIVQDMRRDPNALETMFVSVVAFAGKARTLNPLVDLISFYPPELPVGGGTNLGAGLDQVMHEIDSQVIRASEGKKGDWKPLVFLLTDGRPTSDSSVAVKKWNDSYRVKRANIVAVSLGGGADTSVLRQISDDVLVFMDSAPDAYRQFAQWISNSIKTQSMSVAAGNDGVELSKAQPGLVEELAVGNQSRPGEADDRCVVLVAKCSDSGKPYLIKYERPPAVDLGARTGDYELKAVVPVRETYFEMSDQLATGGSISSDALPDSVGSCPYCGGQALMQCECEKLFCLRTMGQVSCPWCHESTVVEGNGGGGSFDLSRGMG